ncbi:nuclear transport factor 2 family protein [Streptomyces sp. NBC_00859]|uniref:nuclear transport factor 2 family protein n=1 Tax=Streptomyces sp. NBC_00859 TaxID=2903682 RepID=UPI00386A17FD|nr:nuclear transport factor 2 family protein [Streptomyces sp. NBC_00859]
MATQDLTASSKAVVEKYMEALMNGDFATARSLYQPDATWTLAGDLPLSGTWTGPDEILGEFVPAMRDRLVMESLEFEFEGVLGEGERILAEWNTRGLSRSGRPYDQHCLAVFTIRDGRIAAVREHIDTLRAHTALFA